MKNKIKIDKIRRFLYAKNELNTNILKFLAYNEYKSYKTRWNYKIKLTKLKKNSSFSRIHNFCILSIRSKSVLKNFNISRIEFRGKASFNILPGVKKASW